MTIPPNSREIPGYSGDYRIDKNGQPWSRKQKGQWKKLHVRSLKYSKHLTTTLRRNNKRKVCFIHVLLLTTYVGPRPKGKLGCHKDDNPQNNTLTNLHWATPSENGKEAVRNGKIRIPKGEDAYSAKLTWNKVREMRLLRNTTSARQLAIKFGVRGVTARNILAGRSWKE